MKKVTIAVRVLMGLVFVGSGVAFFLTPPPPMEGPIGEFFSGMAATGYFFYLLKGTEIVCGLFLILGRLVPLALVVLAPVILNIFLIHAFLLPSGLPIAIGLGLCECYLAFVAPEYSSSIKALFRVRS